jgi:oxygen-dependent protoporphyrinogen oxidase
MFMVPTKASSVVFSPLFSAATKLQMLRERLFPAHANNADESVASFVARHYGAEVVERLADPLLAGVYGGDAHHLSVRAVLPRFAEMEASYGSLGRAALALRRKATAQAKARPLFTTLKNGMQQMVEALAKALSPAAILLGTPVQLLQRQNGGWLISAGYRTDHFDAAIIATPAPQAAVLLQTAAPELARELDYIPYSSSVTVALGYHRTVRSSLPAGFGFLVPPLEKKRLLAATFVHNKFPFRVPEDRALLRCFLGGTRDEEILSFEDEAIALVVKQELAEILGISETPEFVRVHRWKNAMAQYNVGHLDRLVRIEALRGQLPGLFLAGNGHRGIGVPDCVRSGREAAQAALA